MSTPQEQQLISDLARDVVIQVAPQEAPLFRANSEAYFKNPQEALKPKKGKDEMLGFGPAEAVTFMTPVALAVMGSVVNFLVVELQKSLKEESSAAIESSVKQLFKKFHKPEEKKVAGLTPEQLEEVKKVALEQAKQLKLRDEKAELLADAIVGSLVVG